MHPAIAAAMETLLLGQLQVDLDETKSASGQELTFAC